MMHPDLWDMIVAMAKAFVIVSIIDYAFKLGKAVHIAAFFP